MIQKRVTSGLKYESQVCEALHLIPVNGKRYSYDNNDNRFSILQDWNEFNRIKDKCDGIDENGYTYEIKKYSKKSLEKGIMYSELCSIKNKSQLHYDLNQYNKWCESIPDRVIKKLNDNQVDFLIIENNEVIPFNQLEFYTKIITNWKGYKRITTYVRLKK